MSDLEVEMIKQKSIMKKDANIKFNMDLGERYVCKKDIKRDKNDND